MLRKTRFGFDHAFANGVDALGTQRLILTLRKDQASLPMIVAFEHDKNAAAANAAKRSTTDLRFARQFWQPEPEDVHGRSGLDGFEASEAANEGKATVSANGQFGTKFVFRAVGGEVAHTRDCSIFLDEVLHLGVHH